MIDIINTHAYCMHKDIPKIENYEEAVASPDIWHCHHRLEIHDDYGNTVEDLILMNLYFHRPPEELIFLKRNDHLSIHAKSYVGRKIASGIAKKRRGPWPKPSEETRKKLSIALKGRKLSESHKKKLSEAAIARHRIDKMGSLY